MNLFEKKIVRGIAYFLLILFANILISEGGLFAKSANRPQNWAAPLNLKHLANAYKVDSKVFRSAQPNPSGFKEARGYGITEVLNLREYHNDENLAKNLGLVLHHIRIHTEAINEEEVIQALRIIRHAKGPILIHCWHGSDRTGAICAMYRIIFDKWTKEEAIKEMVNGGFGYHKMFANIIDFIKNADTEKIQKAVLL